MLCYGINERSKYQCAAPYKKIYQCIEYIPRILFCVVRTIAKPKKSKNAKRTHNNESTELFEWLRYITELNVENEYFL